MRDSRCAIENAAGAGAVLPLKPELCHRKLEQYQRRLEQMKSMFTSKFIYPPSRAPKSMNTSTFQMEKI